MDSGGAWDASTGRLGDTVAGEQSSGSRPTLGVCGVAWVPGCPSTCHRVSSTCHRAARPGRPIRVLLPRTAMRWPTACRTELGGAACGRRAPRGRARSRGERAGAARARQRGRAAPRARAAGTPDTCGAAVFSVPSGRETPSRGGEQHSPAAGSAGVSAGTRGPQSREGEPDPQGRTPGRLAGRWEPGRLPARGPRGHRPTRDDAAWQRRAGGGDAEPPGLLWVHVTGPRPGARPAEDATRSRGRTEGGRARTADGTGWARAGPGRREAPEKAERGAQRPPAREAAAEGTPPTRLPRSRPRGEAARSPGGAAARPPPGKGAQESGAPLPGRPRGWPEAPRGTEPTDGSALRGRGDRTLTRGRPGREGGVRPGGSSQPRPGVAGPGPSRAAAPHERCHRGAHSVRG